MTSEEPKLPVPLLKWRNKKLEDLCFCVAAFFNYISEPRQGFVRVDNNPAPVVTHYGKKGAMFTLPGNPSTDKNAAEVYMTVNPTISLDMVHYVVSEIFPCQSMLSETLIEVDRAPSDVADLIETRIRANIENKNFLTKIESRKKARVPKVPEPFQMMVKNELVWARHAVNESLKYTEIRENILTIQPGVVQAIWTYLANGLNILTSDLPGDTDERIIERIEASEDLALAKRNCSRNYGFNYDVENCAFQTILYVIITLMDWLEVSVISESEVMTAYKIIYPRDLQGTLNPSENERIREIIVSAFFAKNMTFAQTRQSSPDDSAVPDRSIGFIIAMMLDVGNRIENTPLRITDNANNNSLRLMARFMGMCQPI